MARYLVGVLLDNKTLDADWQAVTGTGTDDTQRPGFASQPADALGVNETCAPR
ncbi:hypothetical protein [Streptomyces sp. NPDC002537]